MDVHYSSGVFNKAFYELAVTQDWGVKKAFKVFAWANMNCWTPDTTFQQGAECVLEAAIAAHTDPTPNSLTNGEYDPSDVAAAFAVVGITLYLPEAPAKPLLTKGTLEYNSVALSWNDVENEAGYRIIRDDGDNVVTQIDTVSTGTTAYVDSTVSPETSYDYVVEAFNDTGAGASNTVNVVTGSKPATAHITLTVSTYKIKGVNHAELAWTPDGEVLVYVDGSQQGINAESSPYTYNNGLKGGMTGLFQVCKKTTYEDTCSKVIEVIW